MTGSVCAVTGASRGLGRALAGALAARGGCVVLISRDPEAGAQARDEVAAVAVGPPPELVVADLCDFDSIRAASQEIRERHPRLDVLVNNAAVFTRRRRTTKDGLEVMFTTNHLGHFLLTNLLLDALVSAAPARVLTITAPSTVALDFDDLQGEKEFKPLRAFGASKMANLLFAFELQRRVAANGVTSTAVHPGIVRTELMRDAPAVLRLFTRLTGKSAQAAASAVADLALGEPPPGGELVKSGQRVKTNAYSRDLEVQSRLWRISAELTGLPIG